MFIFNFILFELQLLFFSISKDNNFCELGERSSYDLESGKKNGKNYSKLTSISSGSGLYFDQVNLVFPVLSRFGVSDKRLSFVTYNNPSKL